MKKALFALSMAAAVQANAFVSFPGATDTGVTPFDDDFAPGTSVLLGREVVLDVPTKVTFKAIFSEAHYRNAFLTIGNTTFNDNIVDGDSYTRDFDAGVLPFSFFVTNTDKSIVNGGNQVAWQNSGDGNPYFLVTPAVTGEDGFERFFIALNDDGKLIDEDYDDYVIGVTLEPTHPVVEPVPVPEPLPAALLGIGMVGVGLSRLARRGS